VNFFTELFGWYGAGAILAAYALASFGVLDAEGLWYQVLNGTGALGILIVSYRKRALQPALLNTVWALIAVVAVVGIIW